MSGTNVNYIKDRLRRAQRFDLIEAIERGEVSAYSIAVELGWHKRRPTLGTGSENQAKRRAYALSRVFNRREF